MKETNHSMSRKTRTILIVAAILLACFVVVMAIVLIVPHAASANETEIESVEAYNKEHGTDYLYPDPRPQTADLYTNMHTYLYRSGWADRMLRVQFTYVDNYCNLYIQLDADDDLAKEEAFSFLQNFTNLTDEIFLGDNDLPVEYKDQGGNYFAKFEVDNTIYYLNVDSKAENHDSYFFTILNVIVGDTGKTA